MCLQALICVALLCALLFSPWVQPELLFAGPPPPLFTVFIHCEPICELSARYPPLSFYSHCLQRTLIARTLCSGYCAKTKNHIQGKGEGFWVRVMTQSVYAALFALAQRCCTSFPLQVGQELMNPHTRTVFFFPLQSAKQISSCGSKHGNLGNQLIESFYC